MQVNKTLKIIGPVFLYPVIIIPLPLFISPVPQLLPHSGHLEIFSHQD